MEATRQTIGQTIRKLPADSPLRRDLIRLRGALDETMTNAATQSGNPEVAQAMTNLRGAYASKVQAFESNAIKSLAGKNPDTVASALLNKQSVFNVNTLRSMIGPDNMKQVEGSLLQRLVDNASANANGEFNPKSFASAFNRLGPDVQKAIWGDNLPAVKNFLATAQNVPTTSPMWGRMAQYLEHRAVFGALAGGAIFGAGALAGEFSGKHLLGPAAILAGMVALHNPRVLGEATNLLKLGVPIAAGTAVQQNAAPEQSAPAESTPQSIASGASIGEQLRAKAAQGQQKTRLPAQQTLPPSLPFHPGSGISR